MDNELGFEAPAYYQNSTGLFRFDGSGKTVLAFFPGAFTGACTEEMCSLRDQLEEFEKLDTQVIGISIDTPFALKEFSTQNKLEFRLVSDQNAEIAGQYGVKTEISDLNLKTCKRSVFIVEDHEITYSEVLEDNSDLPNIDALKQQLITN